MVLGWWPKDTKRTFAKILNINEKEKNCSCYEMRLQLFFYYNNTVLKKVLSPLMEFDVVQQLHNKYLEYDTY